jgi:hypothetical protein
MTKQFFFFLSFEKIKSNSSFPPKSKSRRLDFSLSFHPLAQFCQNCLDNGGTDATGGKENTRAKKCLFKEKKNSGGRSLFNLRRDANRLGGFSEQKFAPSCQNFYLSFSTPLCPTWSIFMSSASATND